jgi:hypothetical protein
MKARLFLRGGLFHSKNMETTEFIIRDNGTITERTVRERDLEAEESVLEALTSEVSRTVRNVMTIPEWGTMHASVGLEDTIWSVPIDRIPLHARFGVINKVLVPMFASTAEMEMPLVWQAPPEVRLVFVVRTEITDGKHVIGGNWLFAYNKENRGYRLPLPNLHDDCNICTGAFTVSYKSAGEGVAASLEQFKKSKWNADLMRTTEKSQKFFRFCPTNETFETLPILATNWTTLCDKVSTALMERVIL